MSRQIDEIPLVSLKLNYSSAIPLYKQLYDLIRNAILEGKYLKDQRLPGTRSLSEALSISRNTVTLAFQQLLMEGYISGKIGSGTFVNEIPDNFFNPAYMNKTVGSKSDGESVNNYKEKKLSQKKAKKDIDFLNVQPDKIKFAPWTKLEKELKSENLIRRYRQSDDIIPFQNGIPDFTQFPVVTWQKLINKTMQSFQNLHLGYGDAAGYYPLRKSIASYLNKYRSVNCTAEEIIIVNGTQQGLDLTGRALLNSDSVVWLEDPGYFGARASLLFSGAKVFPSPLDNEGLDLEKSIKINQKPDLIFTTPSHQFPLGITMSISRRLNLLQYASNNNCWIIEDDYDSEFRYSGNPLPSLQGLDQNRRVIYIGTFSKVLFPALRIGYIVLPDPDMTDQFVITKSLLDRQNAIFEQVVLSMFIEQGYFTKHLRKMRMLYKTKQEFFIKELNKELGEFVKPEISPSGMHIVAWLPKGSDDKKIAIEALQNKIIVRPLSEYSIKYYKKPGLLLGYTAFSKSEIKKGLINLKKILEKNEKKY